MHLPGLNTFAALLLFTGVASAQLVPGNPLSGLEKLKDFQTMRASSSDPDWKNGNADFRPIAPGATLTLAELTGPGQIVHIWCTVNHSDPDYPSLLTLRMYWDGETNPSVECPLGDFFGVGNAMEKAFTSLPIRVTSNGRGRNCYWPMPFRKSARITITNESEKRCNNFYYYIDWQKHPSLPADSAYFHAMYRQEFPCVMGRNYLIADIEGRGHYVGTVQSVQLVSPGWFGEGDDFFFIDGEKEPSLRGTGTEDYFCDGWGFHEQSGPFYGTPVWEGYQQAGSRGTSYRFHIPDPVVFTKSLRVEIEHKGAQVFPDGKRTGFIERDDLMSSVAFWYQMEPHKPWPPIPRGPERLAVRETPLLIGYKALATAKHSEHPLEIQSLREATDGKQLWFRPDETNAWLEIAFQVESAQSAELICKLEHSFDYGTYRIKLDGEEVANLDLYSPNVVAARHSLGKHSLSAGAHTLRFECVGKSTHSRGYLLGFDALVKRKEAYTRDANVDLRTLQKTAE